MFKNITKIVHILIILCLLVSSFILINSATTHAYTSLYASYDQILDSGPGVTTTHTIGFTYQNTTTPVGSVSIQFCSNSPLNADACDMPAGLDISGAVLAAQTGEVSFTSQVISQNEILLSRNPTDPANIASTYEFQDIVNPSSVGEYYVKINTYSSQTGSSNPVASTAAQDAIADNSPLIIENGGIAFAINIGFNLQTVVPPYITLCSGITIADFNCGSAVGHLLDFGIFTTNSPSYGTSQFLVATNAGNGYTITAYGPTLTSGNNTIPNLSSPKVSQPGTSQFGINLVLNTDPVVGSNVLGSGTGTPAANYSNPNSFLYKTDDIIAGSPSSSNFNKYTVSYLVNISKSQPLGYYATTVSLIALANF